MPETSTHLFYPTPPELGKRTFCHISALCFNRDGKLVTAQNIYRKPPGGAAHRHFPNPRRIPDATTRTPESCYICIYEPQTNKLLERTANCRHPMAEMQHCPGSDLLVAWGPTRPHRLYIYNATTLAFHGSHHFGEKLDANHFAPKGRLLYINSNTLVLARQTEPTVIILFIFDIQAAGLVERERLRLTLDREPESFDVVVSMDELEILLTLFTAGETNRHFLINPAEGSMLVVRGCVESLPLEIDRMTNLLTKFSVNQKKARLVQSRGPSDQRLLFNASAQDIVEASSVAETFVSWDIDVPSNWSRSSIPSIQTLCIDPHRALLAMAIAAERTRDSPPEAILITRLLRPQPDPGHWTPTSHRKCKATVRKTVMTLFLLRQSGDNVLTLMPNELIFEIMGWL